MKKILSGALIAVFIMGSALVSGVHTPAVASQIHPMCWAGYCPDMTKKDPPNRQADPRAYHRADPPRPVTPSPMGNVGF